jgi:uncharacterized protein (DUF305 family)
MDTKSVITVVVVIGLVAGIGGYVMGSGKMASGGMMNGGVIMNGGIDRRFIEEMIPHHEGAIVMAKIALERSKKPEVLTLANNIISAQEKEISDMREWYQSWYGATVTTASGEHMHMMGVTGEPSELSTIAAEDFDREFVAQMIPHHEMAVMMASMLAAGTERDEMKRLAADIISSQSSEIEMMKNWLASWSGLRDQ